MNAIPFLFFSSFVFSVFNFSLNGTSIYFYMFIPFFDFRYAIYLTRSRKKYSYIYGALFILVFLIVNYCFTESVVSAIKPILLAATVGYCVFLYSMHYSQFKYLYYLVGVSIIFSCFQFLMAWIGLGFLVEPTRIGSYIWGGYAIQARGGFEDGLLLPYRVSGLSKEPGFFSSFLLSCLIFYCVDKKFKSYLFLFLIFIGLALSLSKITIAFAVLVPIIYLMNRLVFCFDKINLMVGAAIYFVASSVAVGYIYEMTDFVDVTYASPYFAETYLHRSIGFYLLGFPFNPVVFETILVGGVTQRLAEVLSYFPFLSNLRFVNIQPEVVFFSSSGAYILLQYGLGVLSFYLFLLRSCGVTFYPFLIFSVVTASVNFFAFENWVLLGYVFMLVYASNFRNENCVVSESK